MGLATCSGFTDYAPTCGNLPESFIKMLANCIVAKDGHYFLNAIYCTDYCDDLTSFWDCDREGDVLDPEAALVNNIFALDECGNLAIKILANLGEEAQ